MRIINKLSAIAIVATMFSCVNQKADVKSLETEIDSASYALGLNVATYVKSNFDEANKDLFYQGFRNGLDSTNLLMSKKDVGVVLSSYFQKKQVAKMKEQQEKAIKEAEIKFADVKKAGIEFLEKNKTKKDVKTTASGLQYIVLKEGTGEKPEGPTTKVKVHYHGTSIDGTVFDSSVDRGTPSEFALNQVIKGWTEGVQLMKVGAKYKFFIPQELAYGAQQKGAVIKPFSTLIFEIELLDIIK
ncbi:FKBP-type peptidyl-prolyl cis-trans isomerase [Polaribacter sp. MSW13]|uniref:Peptidyl-prolyl cis-trans isomerase n=1 Tax=Polaribacter marinus TaxID=2916838 RepID=A0A9X1VL24_9FLAO|nr:FKBP-type peptidyl-prolyl cis-trans isomerase [Polaribacter marinus]MCI2228003.1 FKBP-type peptidyl-prolyl cis-trans isomerase [Polaribacter marinus]